MASSANFANVNNNGNANNNNASNSNGVRPLFRAAAQSVGHSSRCGAGKEGDPVPAALPEHRKIMAATPSDESGTAASAARFQLDANSLVSAYGKARRGSSWKASTQRFGLRLVENALRLAEELEAGTYQPKPFVEFMQNERGKERPIRAMHVSDRVVQRALCDEVLVPALRRHLIYDNGASLKGKGVEFTRRRLLCHLSRFYRRHGNRGWILQLDFSKYFDNIPHRQLLERLEAVPELAPCMPLLRRLVAGFEQDVSYGFDAGMPFDMAAHRRLVLSGARQDGSAMLRRSMGIGSQISQIIGVWYPTPVDTWCKCVLGIREYARYMDDAYVIHQDRDFLKRVVLPGIAERCRALGLFLNPKKTHVRPLASGFSFLQRQYWLTETGRIGTRFSKKTFLRMRRRLKKLRAMLIEGRVRLDHVMDGYRSWRGAVAGQRGNESRIASMDKLFAALFGGASWTATEL